MKNPPFGILFTNFLIGFAGTILLLYYLNPDPQLLNLGRHKLAGTITLWGSLLALVNVFCRAYLSPETAASVLGALFVLALFPPVYLYNAGMNWFGTICAFGLVFTAYALTALLLPLFMDYICDDYERS